MLAQALDGVEEPRQESDRIEHRVAQQGEHAVQLEQDATGQGRGRPKTKASQKQIGSESGHELQEGLLDHLTMWEQQQGRWEQRGWLHASKHGRAEAFQVIPERKRPRQDLECGPLAEGVGGYAHVRVRCAETVQPSRPQIGRETAEK